MATHLGVHGATRAGLRRHTREQANVCSQGLPPSPSRAKRLIGYRVDRDVEPGYNSEVVALQDQTPWKRYNKQELTRKHPDCSLTLRAAGATLLVIPPMRSLPNPTHRLWAIASKKGKHQHVIARIRILPIACNLEDPNGAVLQIDFRNHKSSAFFARPGL